MEIFWYCNETLIYIIYVELQIKANQAVAWEQQQQQQQQEIIISEKNEEEEEQAVMLDNQYHHQFPFSEEAQPSSVLELGIPNYQPYRLQPTQPNLQDFGLQFPNYIW